ncbi:MAG: helix-hairpin-helix domain-containing protein [Chloroflexi bacterium]|nr:helix-hairpin-helix domain-containing protein [Chloroflexota bacterium]
MLQRPVYQTTIAVLTLVALVGGLWVLLAPDGPPGVEITQPTAEAPLTLATSAESTPTTGLIDINVAITSELEKLPGIGPVLAERIVAYREANGRFERIDQLMAVVGIGSTIFERISSSVTVGE